MSVVFEATTGEQIRLENSPGYADMTVGAAGDLTITPSGGDFTVAGAASVASLKIGGTDVLSAARALNATSAAFSGAVTIASTFTATGKAAVGGAALGAYNLEIASHARILASGEVSLQLHDLTATRFELVSNASGFVIRDANSGTPTKFTIAPSTGAVTIASTLSVSSKMAVGGAVVSTYNLEIASHARIISSGEVSLQLQDLTAGRFEIAFNGSGFQIRDAGSGAPVKFSIALGTGAVSITNALTIGGNVGFYGAAAGAKPTVTGSRSTSAAITSLLTGLAGLGLITDSTTA